MANRFTRADLIEVPLPESLDDSVCMPLVVMQPTADASDYMLKPNYATNGRPGVVDHAVIADQASTVIWDQITQLPATFPPGVHGSHHLPGAGDPIPLVSSQSAGLAPKATGQPNDYLSGDGQFHTLVGFTFARNEGDCTIDPGASVGSTVFSALVPNPAYGNYVINSFYIYNSSPSYPPAGKVHFGIYDPAIPGWVSCTDQADISVLTSRYTLLRPNLNTTAMNRLFGAGPNSLQWRMVLDVAGGVAAYLRVGIGLWVLQLTNPLQ
jgi:hypothetical protein